MDWTTIITTIIIALFSGSGFIMAIINYKNQKNKSESDTLIQIKNSIEKVSNLTEENQRDIKQISTKVKDINETLSNLTRLSLRVDRALSKAVSTIIQALEDNHINGEGKEARKILKRADDDIALFQEGLIEKGFKDGD